MDKEQLKTFIDSAEIRMNQLKEKIVNWDSDYERYKYEYCRGLLVAYKVCWQLSFNENYDDIYK